MPNVIDPIEPRPQILARVTVALRDVIGDDFADDLDIGMDTSFARDLELESIEFVALAERLKEEYGERVDFTAWLGGMELRAILDLTVGQLVEFIAGCLS